MLNPREIEEKHYVDAATQTEMALPVEQPPEVILHTSRDRQGAASKLTAFIPHQEVDREVLSIEASPSSVMEFEIYTPKGQEELNTLFYIPGTASQTIALQPVRAVLSQISHILDVRVIGIFHNLAPMNKHPIPYNEACEAVNLLLQKSKIKFNKIAIGGDSSGGLLALLVAIQAVHRRIPFSQILLFAPVVNLQATLSLTEKPGQGFGTPKFFRYFVNTYLSTDQKPDSAEVSPYHCQEELLHQLPPVILVSGTEDTLHESIVEFSKKLKRYDLFSLEGANHGFVWQSTDYLEMVRDKVSFHFQHGINPDVVRFFPLEVVSINKPERLGGSPVFSVDQHILRLAQETKLRGLLARQQGDKSILVAIYGESGRGKTQFALNYYYSSQQYTHCYWFDASSEEQLRAQFIKIGTEAKLVFGELNSDKNIDCVRGYLESQNKILVIFDNAPSLEKLEQFIPRRHAHILATSLTPDSWPEVIEMLPLEAEEASRLARKCFDDRFHQLIQAITRRKFSVSPIGLFHAVTYCSQVKIAEEAYFQEIDELGHIQPGENFNYYAVKLNVDLLAKSALGEYRLLQLISIFELSTIPLAVFQESDTAILSALEKRGFVTINVVKKSLFCHTIIQSLVFCSLKADKRMLGEIISQALLNLHCYFLRHPDDDSLVYLGYLRRVVILIEENGFVQQVDSDALISLYIKLADILGFKLNSIESIVLAKQAVMLSEAEAVTDKLKLQSHKTLMHIYWETGEMHQGFEEAKRVLRFCEERKEDEFFRKKLAHSKHNTALFYVKIGNMIIAKQLLKEAFELLETLNDKGEEAIKNRKNQALAKIILSFFAVETKQFDEALVLIEDAERILKAVVPELEKDEMYLSMLLEVKGIYLAERHRVEGPYLLRESLLARIRKNGEIHRLVAETKSRLAFYLEDSDEADHLFCSALDTLYQLYQQDNYFIGDCYFLIGKYLLKFNSKALAQLYFLEALRIRRNQFPEYYEEHYQVKMIRKLLAECGMKVAAIEPAIDDSLRHAFDRRKILKTSFMQRKKEEKSLFRLSACQRYLFFGMGALTTGMALTLSMKLTGHQP